MYTDDNAICIGETALNKLMRNLLELQKTLIEKSLDFVPPNEEKEEREEVIGDWYEGIIEKRHKRLRCYRDKVLDKWSTRLQLANGKITTKVIIIILNIN